MANHRMSEIVENEDLEAAIHLLNILERKNLFKKINPAKIKAFVTAEV